MTHHYDTILSISLPRIGYGEVTLEITPEDYALLITALPENAYDDEEQFTHDQWRDVLAKANIGDPRCMAFKNTIYAFVDRYQLMAGELCDGQILVVGNEISLHAVHQDIRGFYKTELLCFEDTAAEFGYQLPPAFSAGEPPQFA